MNFKIKIRQGQVRKVGISGVRAKSLMKSGVLAIKTARIIPFNEFSLKSILRELYEGLREYIEGLGYMRGYKFLDHESITYFLRDVLEEELISKKFDRYRKLRNGINYYGNDLEVETVKLAIEEIPLIIKKLKDKYNN